MTNIDRLTSDGGIYVRVVCVSELYPRHRRAGPTRAACVIFKPIHSRPCSDVSSSRRLFLTRPQRRSLQQRQRCHTVSSSPYSMPLNRERRGRAGWEHPIVTVDGRLVNKGELDAGTGLYVAGVSRNWDIRADTQEEAAQHLAYLKQTLFREFVFCTPLDPDVAVSMLVTGVERKVMDQAPGYLAHGHQQNSGKTTLAL
jgi:hypothetical protein